MIKCQHYGFVAICNGSYQGIGQGQRYAAFSQHLQAVASGFPVRFVCGQIFHRAEHDLQLLDRKSVV